MMWLTMIGLALAGDLDGFAGVTWGATKGGPGEAGAIGTVFPRDLGEVAYLCIGRPAPAGKYTFFGATPAGSPQMTYLEGKLAAANFMVDTSTDLPAQLKTALGEPLLDNPDPRMAAFSGQHFQNEAVSVSLQFITGGWAVSVVSVPLRKRCVEMYAIGCVLPRTKDEIAAAMPVRR